MLALKLISSASPPRKNSSLLSGLLLVSAVVCASCVSLEKKYRTNTYYVDEQKYAVLKDYYGKFLGRDWIILELSEPVCRLDDLLYSRNAISFTTDNMPQDLAELYKKHLLDETTGFSYYDYVVQHVDRIIICPQIIYQGRKVFGITSNADSVVSSLYPEKSVILISSQSSRELPLPIRAAVTIIHETAHRVFFRYRPLDFNLSRNERYACLMEADFLSSLLSKSIRQIRPQLEMALRQVNLEIEDYNQELGLERANRRLWP